MAEKLMPSVVYLDIFFTDKNYNKDLDLVFHKNAEVPKKDGGFGHCSGFFISEDGLIATSHHCIEMVQNEKDITVKTYNDKNQYGVKIVGTDEIMDVAVLKVVSVKGNNIKNKVENKTNKKNDKKTKSKKTEQTKFKFPYVKFGDSSKLRVGDPVVLAGSPNDQSDSFSTGHIIHKKRSITKWEGIAKFMPLKPNLMQIDNVSGAGNSGGPLFNLDGEIIGVLDAGGSYPDMFATYAVEGNYAKASVEKILKNQKNEYGSIGIECRDLTQNLLQPTGLKTTQGVLVVDVARGAPAEKAGIQKGDIILKINDTVIKNMEQLYYSATIKSGTKLNILINRYGENKNIEVVAGNRKVVQDMLMGRDKQPMLESNAFAVKNLSEALRARYNIPKTIDAGVIITWRNPYIKGDMNMGLYVGDMIQKINGVEIKNLDDFGREIEKLEKAGKKSAVFFVYRVCDAPKCKDRFHSHIVGSTWTIEENKPEIKQNKSKIDKEKVKQQKTKNNKKTTKKVKNKR